MCVYQVELLWRRATAADNDGKIYCLVDADKLGYDVAEKAEQKLIPHGGLLLNAELSFAQNCILTFSCYGFLCFLKVVLWCSVVQFNL